MPDTYGIAVIVASVRVDRIGPVVARWFLRQVGKHTKASIDLIDLAELELPGDLGGGAGSERFVKRIQQADAVVIVTPEYNHGYPGPLKTAIDTAYREWFAKPVGFVSYGGSSGGLRAVEQLRGVFGELLRPRHAESAAGTMLRQLDWWARALATARTDRPYEFAQQ
jgi:NAD(P)H-dependent FMN reductase